MSKRIGNDDELLLIRKNNLGSLCIKVMSSITFLCGFCFMVYLIFMNLSTNVNKIFETKTKICVHIPHYLGTGLDEKIEHTPMSRMKLLNKVMRDYLVHWNENIDIYIHTNDPSLTSDMFEKFQRLTISTVYHNMVGEDRLKLPWKLRGLMKKQRNNYDVFLYLENDIGFPKEAFEYWKKYNHIATRNGFILGFLRIQKSLNKFSKRWEYGESVPIDLVPDRRIQMDTILNLGLNQRFIINSNQPYWAGWIFSQQQFRRFTMSPYYNPENVGSGFGSRERASIGMNWNVRNIIPIIKKTDIKFYALAECTVDHIQLNVSWAPQNIQITRFVNNKLKYIHCSSRAGRCEEP